MVKYYSMRAMKTKNAFFKGGLLSLFLLGSSSVTDCRAQSFNYDSALLSEASKLDQASLEIGRQFHKQIDDAYRSKDYTNGGPVDSVKKKFVDTLAIVFKALYQRDFGALDPKSICEIRFLQSEVFNQPPQEISNANLEARGISFTSSDSIFTRLKYFDQYFHLPSRRKNTAQSGAYATFKEQVRRFHLNDQLMMQEPGFTAMAFEYECADPMQFSMNVHFFTNRSDIDYNSKSTQSSLSKLMKILGRNTEVSVRIEGHTDSDGTEQWNIDLSNRRAEELKKYLINQGIDSSRVETAGYGESRPVSPMNAKEDKEANRRIEVTLKKP